MVPTIADLPGKIISSGTNHPVPGKILLSFTIYFHHYYPIDTGKNGVAENPE